MKRKKDETINKMAVFTLVIIILFMTIVSIELIVVIYTEKINTSLLKDREVTTTTTRIFKDEGIKFRNIDVNSENTYIGDICKNGCYLKTNELSKEYKYVIEKLDGGYVISIVDGQNYVVYSKSLGKYIDNAYFVNYLNYVVFNNVVVNNHFEYDYAIVLDNQGAYDEFESLDRDEMEFTNNGIVYFYDQCVSDKELNAEKVKVVRYPFDDKVSVLGTEVKDYYWCD